MKKLVAISLSTFLALLSLQSSYDAKEEQIEKTIEINDEIISTYEERIKEDRFSDLVSKTNYFNGYRGFLNWVTNTEYKQLDEEFNGRLK